MDTTSTPTRAKTAAASWPRRLAPIHRASLAALLVVAIPLQLSVARAAVVVTYFDGDFSSTDWVTTLGTNSSNVSAAFTVQAPLDGNPDFHQLVVLQLSSTTGGGTWTTFNLFSRNPGFAWHPTIDGAIETIEFAFDIRLGNFSGIAPAAAGMFIQPLIWQDGLTYVSNPLSARATSPDWTSFSFLTDTDTIWSGPGGVTTLDLSADGSPLQFGFRASLSLTCGTEGSTASCGAAATETGVDNYRVTITGREDIPVIPVPASAWLFVSALGLIGWLRRRGGNG